VQLRRATDISDLESRMPQDDPFKVRAVSPTLSSAVAVNQASDAGASEPFANGAGASS